MLADFYYETHDEIIFYIQEKPVTGTHFSFRPPVSLMYLHYSAQLVVFIIAHFV